MRVLVTGGRDFADRDQIYDELDKMHGDGEITLVYLNGDSDVYEISRQWAVARGVKTEVTLSPQPDVLMAFRGTPVETIKHFKAARVYIETVEPRLRCNHISPSTYKHSKDDKGRTIATCPHCGRFMGYVQEGGSL